MVSEAEVIPFQLMIIWQNLMAQHTTKYH